MLTDVPAVYRDFGTAQQTRIEKMTPDEARAFDLPTGSMGPKVAAAANFADHGGFAVIGPLGDALAMLERAAGTRIQS